MPTPPSPAPKPSDDAPRTYSLVYGLKMLPASEVDAVEDAPLTLTDGSTTHVTMHLIEGTREEVRRLALESVDAFFELHAETSGPHGNGRSALS